MYLGSGVVEVFDPGLGTLQDSSDANTRPGSIKPDPHYIQ